MPVLRLEYALFESVGQRPSSVRKLNYIELKGLSASSRIDDDGCTKFDESNGNYSHHAASVMLYSSTEGKVHFTEGITWGEYVSRGKPEEIVSHLI